MKRLPKQNGTSNMNAVNILDSDNSTKKKRQLSLLSIWGTTQNNESPKKSIRPMANAIPFCNKDHPPECATTENTVLPTILSVGLSSVENKQEDIPYQPSEYELLRLRNIARNEARLRDLGLLSNNSISSTQYSKPKKKLKKPLQDRSNMSCAPLRRSTRISGCPETATATTATTTEGVAPEKDTAPAQENDSFTSCLPLMQYTMVQNDSAVPANTSTIWNRPPTFSTMDSLTLELVGPRLMPPSGLSAIYTMQFSSSNPSLIVGAGKSGIISLWDTSIPSETKSLDPVLSWKSHSGRWISSACFIPSATIPLLMTAGNDGRICIWDASSVNTVTGMPRLNYQSSTDLHSSGIFCMDVTTSSPGSSSCVACSGSKDKSVALSQLTPEGILRTTWRSTYHTSKVAAIRIQPTGGEIKILASASDDGRIALHDVRTTAIVTSINNAHAKPHSVEWNPLQPKNQFITAGLDDTIYLFDVRNSSKPLRHFRGHVSSSRAIRSIHHPVFATFSTSSETCFLLTGGEGSNSLSIYETTSGGDEEEKATPVFSQGWMPQGCGDASSIAILDHQICVSTTSGDVVLLAPRKICKN